MTWQEASTTYTEARPHRKGSLQKAGTHPVIAGFFVLAENRKLAGKLTYNVSKAPAPTMKYF